MAYLQYKQKWFSKYSIYLEGNLYCLWITSHVNILAAGTGTKDLTKTAARSKG